MSSKMCKRLALFTVVCCLVIATGNGASTEAVQYDHLDLGTAVYNALKSHQKGSFAISPFGLGTLLTAISHNVQTWRNYREHQFICYGSLHYEEPLGTNESITEIMGNDFHDVKLYQTNKLYAAKNSIYASFVHKTKPPFRFNHTVVDFYKRSEAENTIINDISRFSGGLLQHSISRGTTPSYTSVIFFNILAFKGHFRKAFEKSMFQHDFYQNGRSIGKVPFLYLHDQLKYIHSPEMRSTIVEIPYKEEGFSMIAILPDRHTAINQATKRLALPQILRLLDRSDKYDVALQLPEFKIESSIELKEALKEADLSEHKICIPPAKDPLRGYMIHNDIKQIIYFAVEGEASPTKQHIYPTWKTSHVIKFNRPFLIILRYKELSLIMAEITEGEVSLVKTNPRVV